MPLDAVIFDYGNTLVSTRLDWPRIVPRSLEDLRQALRRDYTPLQALALMLFLLIGTPCMATFAITRRESGSIKWALLQLGGLTALAWLVALLVCQGGRLLGLG